MYTARGVYNYNYCIQRIPFNGDYCVVFLEPISVCRECWDNK